MRKLGQSEVSGVTPKCSMVLYEYSIRAKQLHTPVGCNGLFCNASCVFLLLVYLTELFVCVKSCSSFYSNPVLEGVSKWKTDVF